MTARIPWSLITPRTSIASTMRLWSKLCLAGGRVFRAAPENMRVRKRLFARDGGWPAQSPGRGTPSPFGVRNLRLGLEERQEFYRYLICTVTLSTPGVNVDTVFPQPRGDSTLTSAAVSPPDAT